MTYKRRRQGGGFSTPNIGGQASVRRISEQQQTIINAEKANLLRFGQINDQYLTALKGTQNTEKQNRELLQDLETKAWQNRKDAIRVRAEREIDAIKGEAVEAGKKSKFWAELTPTLSQTFATAATKLSDLADRATHKEQQKKINSQLGTFSYGLGSIKNQNNAEYVKLAEERDQARKRGDEETANALEEILNRKDRLDRAPSKTTDRHLVAQHTQPGVITSLLNQTEQYFLENGFPLDLGNWEEKMRERGEEIANSLGLGNNKHREEFLEKWNQQVFVTHLNRKTAQDIRNQTGNREVDLQTYIDNPTVENLNKFYHTVYSTVDPNTKSRSMDRVQAAVETLNRIDAAGGFDSFAEKEAALGNLASINGEPMVKREHRSHDPEVKYTESNVREEPNNPLVNRYKNPAGEKRLAAIRLQLEEAWETNRELRNKREKANLADEARKEALTLNEEIKSKDFSKTEHYLWAIDQLTKYQKYNGLPLSNSENPVEILRSNLTKYYVPGSFDIGNIERDFLKALHETDHTEMSRLLPNLSTTKRKQYQKSTDQVNDFEAYSGGKSKRKSEIKDIFLNEAKLTYEDSNKLHGSSKEMMDRFENRVRKRFIELYDTSDNKSSLYNKVVQEVTKDLQSETGLFRTISLLTDEDPDATRKKYGLRKEFNGTFWPGGVLTIEEKTEHNKDDLLQAIRYIQPKSLTELFEAATYGNQIIPILSEAKTASLADRINREDVNIRIDENLLTISKETGLSPEKVANAWLEHKGYKERLKENVADAVKNVDPSITNTGENAIKEYSWKLSGPYFTNSLNPNINFPDNWIPITTPNFEEDE